MTTAHERLSGRRLDVSPPETSHLPTGSFEPRTDIGIGWNLPDAQVWEVSEYPESSSVERGLPAGTDRPGLPTRRAPKRRAGLIALVVLVAAVGAGIGVATSRSSAPRPRPTVTASVDSELVDVNTVLANDIGTAAGTGMVLAGSGEVLTNNHVVEEATTVSVTDVGNGHRYDATVVGYDISQDVAVLRLQGASHLKAISIGNSSSIRTGQSVIAIGNAGGLGGKPSAVHGAVTALDQSIAASDAASGTMEQLSGLIQTNAPIQPGDSGGPLVTNSGRVVGMNTAASTSFTFQTTGSEAFAIPINDALSIAKQIESGQATSAIHIGPTAFIGVEVAGSLREGFGGSPTSGAIVPGVLEGTPAAQAGLVAGDVIVSLAHQPVGSPTDLTDLLIQYHPDDAVELGWIDSSGELHSTTIQLGSGPVG